MKMKHQMETNGNGEEARNNSTSPSSNQSIAAEVLSAAIGGMISASALYPLEVIKTKLQAVECASTSDDSINTTKDENDRNEGEGGETNSSDQDIGRSRSAWTLAKTMYETQGISSFYHGIGTSAIQAGTEKALYFFAYTAFKNMYYRILQPKAQGKAPAIMSTTANLLLGCAAEWAHLPITLPIDCLTTRIQTTKNPNASALALLYNMMSEGGMYKGLQAYIVLCFKPAIQYTIYEQVKHYYLTYLSRNNPTQSSSLSSVQAFLLGLISRTISTMVVFPYIRAKVLLQQRTSSSSSSNTIPNLMQSLVRQGGISSLFQGLGPELTRGVLSSALMMMVKEKISAIVSIALSIQKNSSEK
jgi:adenine nucleotide transporter 17